MDLYAIQHIRKMRGGSQSHLMRASDNNYYVVKFTNNPQHSRVLANEFIASRLGQLFSLPIPHAFTIDVDDWLIENTPELRFESAGMSIPVSCGAQLALKYVADPTESNVFDYLPESLAPRVQNLTDFARILVLDKWACNADGRQAVFWRYVQQKYYRATFIDHGYYFNAGEWTFPDLALRGVYYRNYVYQHVKGWDDFEPALSQAEAITSSELKWLVDGLPAAWWANSPDRRPLLALLGELSNRRSKIRDLITDFKDSSRNPFPNWR
jgi:hypothetical protein